MRENSRRTVAVALACAFLPLAGRADGMAEEDRKPCCAQAVDSYRNYTRQVLANCSRWVEVRYRLSISVVDSTRLQGCIAAGTRDSRERLATALRDVPRRPAREALRAYQATFESALTGVEPTVDEPPAAYDQRQISLRHLLAHAWTRYELEEG